MFIIPNNKVSRPYYKFNIECSCNKLKSLDESAWSEIDSDVF